MGKREMPEKCKNCCWWKQTNHSSLEPLGSCVKNPPTVIVCGDDIITAFPETEPSEYCGGFDEKTEGSQRAS
jgi:hypothetical protein